jgi:tagatose 1,6-diphosphate aldolase
MEKLTPGKLAGLKAVSDHRGVIAAAAMDQRGSLQKSLAKERGAAADAHDLEEFKTLVTEVLTKHASAILLDPEYGLPASKHRNGKGLLLAYEKTGYDATTPGRLPDLLDLWSVRRLKEAGADCIKILLYYTPLEKSHVNDLKQAWIERIGDECLAHDIPFFLELVGYDVSATADEKSLAYALKKPEVVSGSMAEFGKARYNVDVLKVEVPIEMSFVEGTQSFKGEKAYTRAEALRHFRDASTMTHKPFIYLSAGVSNPVFIETLELAVESGTTFNGVLCGRATWKDGIPIYAKQGAKAFEDWLNTTGVENINKVNTALKNAHSWHEKVQAH